MHRNATIKSIYMKFVFKYSILNLCQDGCGSGLTCSYPTGFELSLFWGKVSMCFAPHFALAK
jgi:hypothetical protein